MSIAAAKSAAKAAIQSAFENLDENVTASDKAQEIVDALETWILAATVTVTIPSLTVSQGVSPSVVQNPAPIPLTGNLT